MTLNDSFTIPSIPAALSWKNQPLQSTHDAQQLIITAGAQSDWFVDPAGAQAKNNAPIALFVPPDPAFRLQARVTVEFAATFDAGVLFAYAREDLWGKLCFEYSPQQQPMVVSVVTKGISDDCNSVVMGQPTVYLRLYRHGAALAFHYSPDGRFWHFVRHFSLGQMEGLRVGFSAQSPMGQGCQVSFSEIQYVPGALANLRSGE